MAGVLLDEDFARRAGRATRRVERMPLENDNDDGGEWQNGTASIIVEVRVTGEAGGSGSGASGSGGCSIDVYPAVIIEWDNSCGWIDKETIWVFELNDQELNVDQKYRVKLLQHDFTSDGVTRVVGYVDSGGSIFDADDQGSGSGPDCPGGASPVTICINGIPADVCMTVGGRPVVFKDRDGNIVG